MADTTLRGAQFGFDDLDDDRPVPTFLPDGKPLGPPSEEAMANMGDPEWRRKNGYAPLTPLSGEITDL